MPPHGSPPKRRSHAALWVLLSLVGIVAIVVCAACAFFGVEFVLIGEETVAPVAVNQEFCHDLTTQQYDAAYNLFSASLQRRVSQASFITTNQQHDSTDGAITTCSALRYGRHGRPDR